MSSGVSILKKICKSISSMDKDARHLSR